MATEKQFQSELPALLQSLFGSGKTTTKSSSTANTAGLQGVYDAAMKPMDQQLYDNLIASIFNKAATNVPTLTAALANATGGRTTGNSPLALALNEQNNMASKEAAAAILAQQNKQLELAGQAAGGIAQATRSSSQTQQTKPPVNPLLTAGLGFLANQADKRGWFDKLGNKMFGGGTDPATSSFSPMALSDFMSPGMMPDTAFTSFNDVSAGGFNMFSDFNDLGSFGFNPMDLGGMSLFDSAPVDLVSGMDFGFNPMDLGGSSFFDAAPIEDIWNFGGGLFADGGMVGGTRMNSYADGGVVRNRPMMGIPDPRMGTSVINGMPANGVPRQSGGMQRGMQMPGVATDSDGNTGLGDGSELSLDGENALAADAAAGYPQRDAMMGMFAQALAGMVLAGIAPPVAAVTNLTGITKSPMGLLTGMARSGLSQDTGARASPVKGPGQMTITDLPPLDGGADATGNGVVVGGPIASFSGTVTDLGTLGSEGGVGGYGGVGGDTGGADTAGIAGVYEDGGVTVAGPAAKKSTMTSKGKDTVPAKSTVPGGGTVNFQPGEMVIPVDVVNSMGQQFFQRLIDAYHKPIRR